MLVLNSSNMAHNAIAELKAYEDVPLWLDNDTAGDKACEKISAEIPAARDMRKHLEGWEDVNAWICQSSYER